MFTIERHRPPANAEWDAFVRTARNGCFLFERGYLDYHADRFDDASLAVRRGGELLAVLPAHRLGPRWVSHGGLTFGGLVLHAKTGARDALDILQALADALRERGATQLVYKPLPHIYQRQPSEDDLYALHRLGARAVRCELWTTVDLQRRLPLAPRRRRALAKARRAGVQVSASTDYEGFWALLQQSLWQRHGVRPVHSAAEIRLLASRFRQISLVVAHDGAGLLAGALVYDHGVALHTQYLATSPRGRELGALDAVIAHVADGAGSTHRWLGFGSSTEQEGRVLNDGLAAYKEMLGGRSTVQQTLELEL